MLGSLHMTMHQHFDMNELFQHLVTMDENRGKTKVSLEACSSLLLEVLMSTQ